MGHSDRKIKEAARIQLSEHFTFRKLIRFILPSIVMMIFTSIYSVVDGLFVSNLVGDLALSAVNIVFPISMIIGAFGFMLGTGGSAVVAKTIGEGKQKLANQYFSMIIYAVIFLGVVLSVVCLLFMEPLARLAGASDLIIEDCVVYGRILVAGSVFFMLQTTFQSFFVVAEKPQMGLFFTIAAGVTNMVLDFVLIRLCKLGIAGAGYATVIGYMVGGVLPIAVFMKKQEEGLSLCGTGFYKNVLIHSCTNGSSEMMSNIATSVISILYNIQLMRIMGESGVAAYAVMMYVDFIFLGTFFGIAIGSAPIVSYHYGAGNWKELRSFFGKMMVILTVLSVVMVALSLSLNRPLSSIFVGYDKALLEMTVHGFSLFALNYLFSGFNVFASAFFTALCNGTLSLVLSFFRTLLLRGSMVLLLPIWWEVDGIWFAVVAAEGLGMVMSVAAFAANQKRYHYDKFFEEIF